ncbi:phosphoribosylformylglycinamidine cyclo-ligase [Haliangium sp. UPWRP_2]|uniref:phosphoribosylformylglycinamidine cyclo-ligase n=1 Tax=Haliangium sp. UPWRP_2 TaxID=1931276 RepID=UPI001304C3B0|nr:phosphoribosylformylglycinamidine cyclo-ligase [Haliangium sp. UPWRP_2]
MKSPPPTYRQAGVDLALADHFAAQLRQAAQATHDAAVVDAGEAYAGLYRPPLAGLADPLLAATCDGVGTKLLVARDCADYRGIGQDLVAMNVNDLLPRGARPLFFLDYIAAGVLASVPLPEIAAGMLAACRQVGCALLGGETAELPDAYRPGDCDLAGFAVGLVDRGCVPRGGLCAGDLILGYPSNGIHANGLSLARKILSAAGLAYADRVPELAESIGAELLRPTRLYVEPVLRLMSQVPIKAAAHVTGGGLLRRALGLCPEGLRLWIDPDSYVRPPIFSLLARLGGVAEDELAGTFNLGLGFLLVAGREQQAALAPFLDGDLRVVGEVRAGPRGVELGYAAI